MWLVVALPARSAHMCRYGRLDHVVLVATQTQQDATASRPWPMTEPTSIDGPTKRLRFDLPSIRNDRRAAPVSGQVLHALGCDHTESDRHHSERRHRGTEPSKSVGVSPDPVADGSDPDTHNPHANHSYRAGCEQTSHTRRSIARAR
jgi:hypothetical protein